MYYAVKIGREKGVYNSWAECQKQVQGYPNAVFKKFSLKSEAEKFLLGDSFAALKKDVQAGNLNVDVGHVLSPDEYYVYTDGSYSESIYAWAFAVIYAGEVIHQDYGVGTDVEAGKTRNIAGELTAVMRACIWCKNKGLKNIILRHDLQGSATWAKGEWKRNNMVTEKYYEFMKRYVQSGFIRFEHVRGHTGEQYNELVDKLAKKAITEHLDRQEN